MALNEVTRGELQAVVAEKLRSHTGFVALGKELNEGLAALDMDIGAKEPVRVTASFGLALLDPDIPVDASIDRAYKALYAAKAAGMNCVRVWNPSM